MHNESPLPIGRVDCQSTREVQPTNSRLYQSQSQSQTEAQRHGIEQQRQRARRTAMWVGAIAVLVYVGFILSGVIGR
ncbi:TPA: hypothetical protein ACOENG_001213 [Stenotrophomonas maltophilia]|jgi:hypothetical protein|uniref:Transmembrane protein n=1 Tax=Stenotrophomonas maltophilia TaxID=40324 RepID=A0AAI9G5E0_STEMA|nr:MULTISPECIES: hypothetical protein [Stenotrophomonas]SSM90162.1 Uncharacterised protein [Acinetobacter baumannii]EJP77958.1 hypothetical protein A1OC_00326 [Stenotrophomonas maltophilia Ab55555]EKT2105728.1 hypothetical protein [Stenotrophomonas maltophilia]EKT4067709.1 hypothetical protein [Stenotrophomonas maltophilia]EKT4072055.1 hypothetical protein [Stenotrophomonas maltophilia]